MTKAIDKMDVRLDAVETLLIAELTTRNIKRSLLHYQDQDDIELTAGILTIVSAGERAYKNQLGMVAKEGTGKLMLIGHLKVPESNTSKDTEDAEIIFMEELKTALRVGIAGLSFALERIEHSRQLEHPYGWFVAFVDAGPPLENNY